MEEITGEFTFNVPQKREEELSLVGRVKEGLRVLAKGKKEANELTQTKTYSGISPSVQHLEYLGTYAVDQDVPFTALEKMRKDGVVKAGMAFKRAPILGSLRKAKITCEDPKIQAFLDYAFMPHLHKLAISSLRAFEFGIAFHEKVFEKDPSLHVEYEDSETGEKKTAYDGYALIPKKYKYNHPMTVPRLRIDTDNQEYNGYIQSPDIEVSLEKSFTFTVNDINSLWGESELIPAYPYWYWKEMISAYYLRYMEKRATPPLVGRAPPGKNWSADNEDEVDNLSWLVEVGRNLRDGMIAAFPSEYDQNGRQLWDLNELAVSARGDQYQQAVNWLELSILRSVLVPDKPISQMLQLGSYSLAEVQFEAFLLVSEATLAEFLEAVEKDILRQLVALNFGERAAKIPVNIQVPPLSDETRARFYEIFKVLLGAGAHPGVMRLDMIKLARELDIPVLPKTEVPEEGGGEQVPEQAPEKEAIPEEEVKAKPSPPKGATALGQAEKTLVQIGDYLEKILEEDDV